MLRIHNVAGDGSAGQGLLAERGALGTDIKDDDTHKMNYYTPFKMRFSGDFDFEYKGGGIYPERHMV